MGTIDPRQVFGAYQLRSAVITDVAGNPFAEINRRNELYAPVVAWCHTLPTTDADHDQRDLNAEFLVALDQIVQADFFDVRELWLVLVGNWWDDTAEPIVVDEIKGYCDLARRRREELELRGEAKKRETNPHGSKTIG